jgi:hypothetical protein
VSKQKAKPKSPRKPKPQREPRYEILAEGNPPRPVKSRSTDEDPFAPRSSPPKTGPKTKEGKDRCSQNALKHGLCQDIRHFKVLPGEDQSIYEHTLTCLLLELEPWDSTSEYLIKTINQARWHLDRSEFNLQAEIERQDGDFINPSLKFERYRASPRLISSSTSSTPPARKRKQLPKPQPPKSLASDPTASPTKSTVSI